VYTITLNTDLRIIEVKLVGLCTLDEFGAFAKDLRSAITTFPRGMSPPATLYDFTDATIQLQEVVSAMKALAENPVMVHRRVAMYTEGMLARRQAERICENRTNMFVFSSRGAALEWLATSGSVEAGTTRKPVSQRRTA
jgi:hypothetical protein